MERNICNETFLFHKYWEWNGEICIDNIGQCMVYCYFSTRACAWWKIIKLVKMENEIRQERIREQLVNYLSREHHNNSL